MEKQADIGLVGLSVMGSNLALNMNDRGFRVAVYNRTTRKVDDFLKGEAKGTHVIGTHSLKELIATLKKPRKLLFMIRAGEAIDQQIEECLSFLEPGDLLIDGGNSHYVDTERRCSYLEKKGILFIGTGISGGEEGARHGPSIMPGGNLEGWKLLQPIFQAIAAKSSTGVPCCDWVGEGGSGHYVKMVHNGIEYGDMQIIGEAYHLLSQVLGLTPEELQKVYQKWNEGELNSYLIEITSQIFGYRDKDHSFLIDNILDVAGQKGTGKWAGISAFELGIPLTLIGEAVFARCLSAQQEDREKVRAQFADLEPSPHFKNSQMKEKGIQSALYGSKIVSYAQGFTLMRSAALQMKWKLDYGSIAKMWRGGCIIRSRFLDQIAEAFLRDPNLPTLLIDPFFASEISRIEKEWRETVSLAIQAGVPVPCFSAALSFFDGYRTKRLPANLLQAQRDFFGAHMYERKDRPRGQFFHTNWTGSGGRVSSSRYNL